MKVLLLTVAGLSSRFSKSIGYPCLKCLYYKHCFEESLLYRMLARHSFFEKIIIVGGYRFKELNEAIDGNFNGIKDKLVLVENKEYATYGSGYSFYKGFEAIKKETCRELVFAEGDLFFDDTSFERICNSSKSVMTYQKNPIESDKSVVFYISTDGKPHYIYDTEHHLLEISEPFSAVYNSGQVWKFTQLEILDKVIKALKQEDLHGTNLVPINSYFQKISKNDFDIMGFEQWVNCNTVGDFENSLEAWK